MSPDEWRESSRGSPIKRAKRRGFLRNAAVALGNRRDPASVPALVTALADTEPVVRSHAAWALGRNPSAEARKALDARRVVEDDPSVLEEIVMALDRR
jgi:epoxyqueuosine reductase